MDQKIKTKNNHPYVQYENTKEWKIIKKALFLLEKNKDISLMTQKEYIIGFLTKQLLEEKLNCRN